MFGNKYLYLAVSSINIVCCVCYVNFEQFKGFDNDESDTQTATTHIQKYLTTRKFHKAAIVNTSVVTARPNFKVNHTNSNDTKNGIHSKRKRLNSTAEVKSLETFLTELSNSSKINIKDFRKRCPENERPMSLGTYEIPTQRDLVLFTKRTLLKMFKSYHEKTLYLLKDIKEASRATIDVEKKCHGKGKSVYRECVKVASKKCISIIKELVASLERQKAEVTALTEDKICNLTSMRTDPILLIKTLAMDEATLDFALPSFLRLLGGCAVYCHSTPVPDHRPRLRQLTDQELVAKHFLTRKNYVQLINDNHLYV